MSLKFAVAIGAVLLSGTSSSSANAMGVMAAETLSDLCTTDPKSGIHYQADATCLAYIVGVKEGLTTMFLGAQQMVGNQNPQPLLCIPAYATPTHFRDIFLERFRRGTSTKMVASEMIFGALLQAYPCK